MEFYSYDASRVNALKRNLYSFFYSIIKNTNAIKYCYKVSAIIMDWFRYTPWQDIASEWCLMRHYGLNGSSEKRAEHVRKLKYIIMNCACRKFKYDENKRYAIAVHFEGWDFCKKYKDNCFKRVARDFKICGIDESEEYISKLAMEFIENSDKLVNLLTSSETMIWDVDCYLDEI